MFGFCLFMFISFNSLSTPQYNTFTLGSKTKLPKNRLLKNLVTDVVEISQKQEEMLPRKMEFSELEQKFNELLLKRDRVILNAMTQKQNLRLYYSSQDYYDYKELLKEKQRLNGQMRNLAKKADKKLLDMEFDMYTKRQYNRYAPKVYDTKNK